MENEPFLSFFAQKKILIVANAAWNIWNFRADLIRELMSRGALVVCAAPADGYETKLLATFEGLQFVPLNHLSRKGISLFENLLGFWEIRRLMQDEKPDLSLLYTIKPIVFGHFSSFLLKNPPVVATYEGLGYLSSAKPWFRNLSFALYRLAFKASKLVIFLNQENLRAFTQKGIVSQAQARLIHGIGIDTQRFRPIDRSAPTPPDRIVFLFVGRLLVNKGIRAFVQAAQNLRASGHACECQILGKIDPGNPSSISNEELSKWENERAVRYLGHTDDVRPYLASADAVVLPSLRGEGLSRVLLEALAMGLPIITTDSPGCIETVEHTENGYVTKAGEMADLLAAMQRFLALPLDKKRQMGLKSRQKAEQSFSNEIILPQYLQLFEVALSASNH